LRSAFRSSFQLERQPSFLLVARKLVARGSKAPAIPLPFDQHNEVIVQLINSDGTCWETKYQSPARRSTDVQFLDRAELP
jgi:hypothetical protein